jgi:hypothetical protein
MGASTPDDLTPGITQEKPQVRKHTGVAKFRL